MLQEIVPEKKIDVANFIVVLFLEIPKPSNLQQPLTET